MKRYLLFISLIFSLFQMIFQSCKSLETTAPPTSYQTPVFEPITSVIGVPVEIDAKDLEAKINKELTGVIYEDNSFDNNDNDNIKVKASKPENITFSVVGNELTYRIPLKLVIQVKKIIIFPEVTANLALKFKTSFTINNDWSLKTKTVTNGYEWLSTPTINIAGFDMSIRYLADIILSSSKDLISKEIDNAIKSNIKLKSYAEEAWNIVQKPIKLEESYNSWLMITPQEIMSTQVVGSNNKINLSVGIKSVNQVILGNEPKNPKTVPLPSLTLLNTIEPEFKININTALPFSKVNEIANNELKSKKFKFGKKEITVNSINLYGSDGKLAVELEISGSINGKIYLLGSPYYDKEDESLKIKDVDFDLNTKNKLLKSADWLLHGTLVSTIEKSMVFPLTKYIEQSKKAISENLDGKIVKGVTLHCKLNDVTIQDIFITKESILTVVCMQGVLSVIINNLSKI